MKRMIAFLLSVVMLATTIDVSTIYAFSTNEGFIGEENATSDFDEPDYMQEMDEEDPADDYAGKSDTDTGENVSEEAIDNVSDSDENIVDEELLGAAMTPYAIWTEGNNTLTFLVSSSIYYAYGTFDGQTITELWSGEDVTNTGTKPGWNYSSSRKDPRGTITTVVFDQSFKTVKPLTTNRWFYLFRNLQNIDLSGLNTSEVTDMSDMFLGCSALTSLDVSAFDTTNVTDMSHMFGSCSSLTGLNVDTFVTTNVTSMDGMFAGCSGLTSLDVSAFNTENVTDIGSMFKECSGLTALNVSTLNTENVTDMSSLFSGCSGLTALNLSSLVTSKVDDMSFMFNKCSGLETLDISTFNTSMVTDMESMFSECDLLTDVDISMLNTANLTKMKGMFWGCDELTNIDLSGLSLKKVTDMSYLFNNCSKLTDIDMSDIDTAVIENMSYMFSNCSSLQRVDISSLDTATVNNMSYMFNKCSELADVYIGDNNTSCLEDMSHMFDSCSSLAKMDISLFDTSNVKKMNDIFAECSSLESVFLGHLFNNSNTDMKRMFYNCTELLRIYVTSEFILNSTKTDNAFVNCNKLIGGNGTTYDWRNNGHDYFRIDGGEISPGYLTLKELSVGYTVTFNPNGGTVSPNKMITSRSGRLSTLPRPRKEGNRFDGWYTAINGGDRVTGTTVFYEDSTVFAHWKTYNAEDRVTIIPISPERDEKTVGIVDEGNVVNYVFSFQTEIPVTRVNTANGTLRIMDYDTDKVVFEVSIDRLVKIKPSGTGSLVSFTYMNHGIEDGTRYYIEIDDGFLNFEDGTKFAFTEKDDWTFKTSSRVLYLDENETSQNRYLPYKFDVDDSYFLTSSYNYNWNLAMIAYGLALGAFESYSRNGDYERGYLNIQRTFESFRFENFEFNDWYTKKPTPDSIGVSAATRVVMDGYTEYTVIALPIRGAGYGGEWASNATVGDEVYHKGFSDAADQVMAFLRAYIVSKGITGNVKVLITGYSRAAGVSNIVAARLDDGALSDMTQISLAGEGIYSFCFEPPAVTTRLNAHDEKYKNIKCFVNSQDFVPMVPSSAWGFTRFGEEYYFNESYRTDSRKALFEAFLNNYHSVSNTYYDQSAFCPVGDRHPKDMEFWLNSFIIELSSCIGRWKFVKELQPDLQDILKEGLLGIDDKAMEKYHIERQSLTDLDKPVTDGINFFNIIIQIVRHKMQLQTIAFMCLYSGERENLNPFHNLVMIKKGYDNLKATFSDKRTGTLIIQEHKPLVNFAWLMTCKNVSSYSKGSFKYILVNCPVDVQLYDRETNELVAEIIDDEPVFFDGSPVYPVIDANEQKMFVVPVDRSYDVRITATDDGQVNYCLLEGNKTDGYTKRVDYTDIDVQEGDVITGEAYSDGSYTLKKGNTECESEVQTEIAWQDVTLNSGEYGTAYGSGTFMKNQFVIARATPDVGADFAGWYDAEGNLISEDAEYRFRVEQNVEYTAKFKERDGITAVVYAEDLTYTGTAQKPEVKVYDGVTELTPGMDYSITYKNNTNAYTLTEEDDEFDANKAPSVIVTGKGNYKGKDIAYFIIQPKDIEAEDVSVSDIPSEAADGKDKKPVPKIKWVNKSLVNKKDYTIEYLNEAGEIVTAFRYANTDGSHYTVKITGRGNYSGTAEVGYVILKATQKPVDKLKITVKNKVYTGEAIELEPDELIVKDGSRTLVKDADYTVGDYDKNTEIGTASFKLTGIGEVYKGTRTVTFMISGGKLQPGFVKDFKNTMPYNNGEAVVQPDVKLINSKTKAELSGIEISAYEGISDETEKRKYDYTYAYENNTAPGKADVLYTGINGYAGTIRMTFVIQGIALSKAVVDKTSLIASYVYDGTQKTQDGIRLTYKANKDDAEEELSGILKSEYEEKTAEEKLGYDYVYEYKMNKNAGTATMTLSGVNRFTGTVNKTYKITPYVINPTDETEDLFTVSLERNEVAYSKGKTTPEPVVRFNGEELIKDKDYTVSYVNNSKIAGSDAEKPPTVKITGKGNFKGTDQSTTFSIVPADIENCGVVIMIPDKVASTKAGKWISTPVLTDRSGKRLTAGTDYYKDNDPEYPIKYYKVEGMEEILLSKEDVIGAGYGEKGTTIKVVVTGKGSYTGTIIGTYRVVKADISKTNVTTKAKKYTGRAVTLSDDDFVWKNADLTLGEDFEIVEDSYKNNLKKGSASVLIRGLGEYGGTKTISFTIGEKGFIWWFRNLIQ